MGSSSSYESSSSTREVYSSWSSTDEADRTRARSLHREKVAEDRAKISALRSATVTKPLAARPPERDEAAIADARLARNRITRPSTTARRVMVCLIDNSGSNRQIAEHLRRATGHFTSFLRSVDGSCEVATVYFSDHCDGALLMQEIDFVGPTPEGDRVLLSSSQKICNAGGGDVPEAIECALKRAAEIDFAHIPRENRTLVLVTDVVPHGMPGYAEAYGAGSDDGCPHQVSWRESMRQVRATYGEFVLVGSGADPKMRPLQAKMFENAQGRSDPEEVARNFVDLSEVKDIVHRNGLVGNTLLFVAARKAGVQSVNLFLASLYGAWLANPLFGNNTDHMARARIRFMAERYLTGLMSYSEIQEMLKEVLAE